MPVDQRVPSDSVLRSIVEKLRAKAEAYLGNREKLKDLLAQARAKVGERTDNQGPLADVWDSLTALVRLLQAYYRHEYTDLPRASIVAVVAAVIYFVAPLDLIPDFIPVAGFLDDAAVIAFVIAQIRNDIDKFMAWEAEQSPGNDPSQV